MSDLSAVITALRATLEANPRQPELWLHLCELLEQSGDLAAAIDALRSAELGGGDSTKILPRMIRLLRQTGGLSEALIRVEAALQTTPGEPALLREYIRILLERGDREEAETQFAELRATNREAETLEIEELLRAPNEAGDNEAASAEALGEGQPIGPANETEGSEPADTPTLIDPIEVTGSEGDLKEWAEQFDWGDLKTDFKDVVGLEEVKRQIRLRIIAPIGKSKVMRAFGRRGGGGILLYGPPGCGKTYIAKATAGEVSARFISVGIHEVLDKYYGESEKMIHALFEEARRRAPTVLFFDEFDAFAAGRRAQSSPFYQTVVDQLLQEMDGMDGNNEDVLVFAATNVPWHVDTAFRRPGRFDRLFFLPPPDQKAREEYLRRSCEKLPGGEAAPVKRLSKETDLFTFADLKSLVERASERALERSLESGDVHPVSAEDFLEEVPRMYATSGEWLSSARNYAQFANEGGQYDELRKYLRKVKRS